jgi:hypothetical protein
VTICVSAAAATCARLAAVADLGWTARGADRPENADDVFLTLFATGFAALATLGETTFTVAAVAALLFAFATDSDSGLVFRACYEPCFLPILFQPLVRRIKVIRDVPGPSSPGYVVAACVVAIEGSAV